MELRKGYISTSVGQLHFRETGQVQKSSGNSTGQQARPSLVLLHQTASSSEMFARLLQALLEGPQAASITHVWMPDLPGFGQSDAPNHGATIELHAGAIRQAMEALGLQRVWLLGHHTGASVAVELAAALGDQVAKLVLSGPCGMLDQTTCETLENAVRIFEVAEQPRQDGNHLEDLWRRLRGKDPRRSLDFTQSEVVRTLIAGADGYQAYRAVCAHAPRFRRLLPDLCCPVLFMSGSEDPFALACLQPAFELARQGRARKVERYVIDSGTSYINESDAGPIARQIEGFLFDEDC